jgi:hypothetical protein
MKKLVNFLLMILLSGGFISCEKKEKNRCTDFKTGTFRFLDSKFRRFAIVRSESTQTETDSVTGLTITGDVDWTSDCSYKVTYTKVSDAKYASVVGLSSTIQILAVFDDKLTIKSQGVGGTMELEMIKTAP